MKLLHKTLLPCTLCISLVSSKTPQLLSYKDIDIICLLRFYIIINYISSSDELQNGPFGALHFSDIDGSLVNPNEYDFQWSLGVCVYIFPIYSRCVLPLGHFSDSRISAIVFTVVFSV